MTCLYFRLTLAIVALIGGTSIRATPRLAVNLKLADTLPLRLHHRGNFLGLRVGSLCGARAEGRLRYAGGRRFILKEVADAEQHFFLEADSSGEIRRLYWLQAEELLPGLPGGYDYSSDSLRTVGEILWWVNQRSMNGSAQPGSDRAAMVTFLGDRGFRLPHIAPRLRLVHVPEPQGKREFMVVYMEAAGFAGADTSFSAMLGRATQGLQFQRCG